MLFNTLEFLIFFIIIFSLYYLLKNKLRYQNLLLLIGSYIFYGWWDYRFLFLITLSTAIDYTCALMIDEGKIDLKNRVKVALYLMFSSIFFLVFNYKAIQFQQGSLFPTIDFSSLINPFGIKIFIAILIILGVINIVIEISQGWKKKNQRFFFLITSIVFNLGLLGVFKYFNFFIESFSTLLTAIAGNSIETWSLNIILPVGISFYTFQTLSYTFDIYKKDLHPIKSLVDFSTYVAFFPQLVAGPIERAKHLIPQFLNKRKKLSLNDWEEGLWLILWGLYKKVVIADNLARIVNSTFGPFDNIIGNTTTANGAEVLIAIYAFAFQIYCDFSGYSDIARGTARLLGFNLKLNFNLPYFSTSPSGFWNRWHISLSSWLRDYLYIPLGGNRVGRFNTYRNLFLTMLLGGLWHGASWTFVIWGAFQGTILIIYRLLGINTELSKSSLNLKTIIQWFIMFQLICLGWLIFRAQNISTITTFLNSIIFNFHWSEKAWANLFSFLYYTWFLIAFQIIQFYSNNLMPLQKAPHWFLKFNVILFLLLSILTLSRMDVKEFIYFAF